jgi:hypothetical protein
MPGRKKGKKEKKVERSQEETELRNEQLNVQLETIMMELAAHSPTLFNYGFKCYEVVGRGIVYIQYDSLEAALARKGHPLEFRADSTVKSMEYAPAISFTAQYDPALSMCLVVAIKTGDERDAVMKVAVFHPSMKDDILGLTPGAPTRLTELTFVNPRSSDRTYTLGTGARFCLSMLCWSFERKAAEYKACQRCKFRIYCGRGCQVSAWTQLGHKKLCLKEKVYTEKLKEQRERRRQQKAAYVEKQQMEGKLASMKKLAAKKSPPPLE